MSIKARPKLGENIILAAMIFAAAYGGGVIVHLVDLIFNFNGLVDIIIWWLGFTICAYPMFMLHTKYFPHQGAGQAKTSHGSAGWSALAEMRQAGHIKPAGATPDGFVLGRASGTSPTEDNRFLVGGHVLTCAPTGAGKGVAAVIPNLLTYPGSALVVDIKGENAAVTARARRALGPVYVIDPFGVTGQPCHGFNWLDRLDPADPNVVAESSALVEMLFVVNKNDDGNFWDDSAKDLVRGLAVWVASLPENRRHIGTVREILTGPADALDETLADMAVSDIGFNIAAKAANGFMASAERVRADVLAAARRQTAFLDDPRIAATLTRSDFRLSDLKSQVMTVYIVMPPAMLKAQTRFIRAFIGQALSALTATHDKPRHNVALFIDEFGQLGHMAAIEDGISLVRGYGVSLWLFIQDLSQLKGVYPKWQTFLANSAKQFFGTADLDTAKYISESLGNYTLAFETTSATHANSSTSTGESEQYTGRSLLTPDEVMRLGSRPIVLIRGERPHILTQVNYLNDHEYKSLSDPNPYHS